jgi:hypothetical protein
MKRSENSTLPLTRLTGPISITGASAVDSALAGALGAVATGAAGAVSAGAAASAGFMRSCRLMRPLSLMMTRA